MDVGTEEGKRISVHRVHRSGRGKRSVRPGAPGDLIARSRSRSTPIDQWDPRALYGVH